MDRMIEKYLICDLCFFFFLHYILGTGKGIAIINITIIQQISKYFLYKNIYIFYIKIIQKNLQLYKNRNYTHYRSNCWAVIDLLHFSNITTCYRTRSNSTAGRCVRVETNLPGTSFVCAIFFYSKYITRKCFSLKVKVLEYNIHSGATQWRISTSVNVIVAFLR